MLIVLNALTKKITALEIDLKPVSAEKNLLFAMHLGLMGYPLTF